MLALTEMPLRAVRSVFGAQFGEGLLPLPEGEWTGPVVSGFGLHLVFIEDREQPPEPVLEDVREEVLRDFERERREARAAELMSAMRQRYRVVIAMPPPVAAGLESVR